MLPRDIESLIEPLFDHPPAKYTDEHFRVFQAFKDALNRGEVRAAQPDASAKTGWRERLGEEGNSAGIPHGRDHGHVHRSREAAVLR
jgi:hypothetical protein